MDSRRGPVGTVSYAERMSPLPDGSLTGRQREVADELIRGPRGGVKGPFVPLLRCPELLERLGKVGEYLRFGSSLPAKISEVVMLIVARDWTNPFEWAVHVPFAQHNGASPELIRALAEGRHPSGMASDEQVAYDLCRELERTKGVCDTTYRRAVEAFGEPGVVDIVAIYGYFTTVCALMNVAHTPPPADARVEPLDRYPL